MADEPPKRLSLAQKRALAAPLFLGSEYREIDEAAPAVEPLGWTEYVAHDHLRKKLISLRVDPEVLDYFRSQGPGYQTRINAVLQAYVRAKKDLSRP